MNWQPRLPSEIEAESFRRIEAQVGPHHLPPEVWFVVRRMIHTSADPEYLASAHLHPRAITAGVEALRRGCPVATDTRMLMAGISTGRLDRLGVTAFCLMDDPDVAAARSYFRVNLDLLKAEFTATSAKPPAAFDVRLYNAAKSHSDYLISIDASSHTGQFDRISAEGFHYLVARGNVFAYCKTALYGHAGFNIDWGYGGDGSGMQDDRGHRKAVMSIDGSYTNVGIAAVPESNPGSAVGPLVVTGNYCNANLSYAGHYNLFIVGTVWEDKDGDSLYDPGEGIGGVTVAPSQGSYYAVTANSGGYAIPLSSGGSYEVSFSGLGIPSGSLRSVTVGSESVLLDLLVGPAVDFDHDGVPDAQDAFPTDPNEWQDTDNDGTGDNADTDDDGDGMPDGWEVQYGLNPLLNDALGDKDGDRYTNFQEYEAGTDPTDRRSKPRSKAMPWLPLLLSN